MTKYTELSGVKKQNNYAIAKFDQTLNPQNIIRIALKPVRNGSHFADDSFKYILLKEMLLQSTVDT